MSIAVRSFEEHPVGRSAFRWAVGAYNALGHALLRARVSLVSLERASMEREAMRRTELPAEALASVREPVDRLLESALAEGDLNPYGRRALRGTVVGLFAGRLRIAEALRRSQGITNTPIERPIVIVGWFRTGTTLLHRLLATHPDLRWLTAGEVFAPAPDFRHGKPRGPSELERERRRLGARMIGAMLATSPKLGVIHPMGSELPVECGPLLNHTFLSRRFDTFGAYGYSSWLRQRPTEEIVQAYEYYRTLLQLLVSQRGGERLLLKYPGHLEYLDVLRRVFPDACVIRTHRDPLRVIGSACSLHYEQRTPYSEQVDPRTVGRYVLDDFVHSSARASRADGVLDVSYSELVADPIAMTKRIYAFTGLDWNAEIERRARAYLEQDSQDKAGRHEYDLETFGLEPSQIGEKLAAYYAEHRANIECQ